MSFPSALEHDLENIYLEQRPLSPEKVVEMPRLLALFCPAGFFDLAVQYLLDVASASVKSVFQ